MKVNYVDVYSMDVYVALKILDIELKSTTPRKTNVTMESQPFEGIYPFQNGVFPLSWC